MGKKLSLITAVAIQFLALLVYAQTKNIRISDSEIFNKCYLKMFKAVVPRTPGIANTLSNEILAKSISGPEACMILLNQSEFMDNGVLKPAKSSIYAKLSAAENQSLISTFHNFHNTWFSKKSLDFLGGAEDAATYVVKDKDEPSLYLTRALFGNNIELSTFFTANTTLKGVRAAIGGTGVNSTTRWQSKPFSGTGLLNESYYSATSPGAFVLSYGTDNNSLSSMVLNDTTLVPFGKIIGVETAPNIIIPTVSISGPTINIISGDSTLRADMNAAIAAKRTNVSLFEHMGGGVLGSQTYIMTNTNLVLGQVAPGIENDPDKLIARRISSRVFADLLCQQLPTLTEADVINDVMPTSPHGFRLSASCMACHTSLDPMAYTFRNFASYRTSTNANVAAGVSHDATRAKGTPVAGFTKLAVKAGTKLFTLKQPDGALNYRDHNNILIKKPVNNIEELGLELSKSDDFYRCVTKRYYEFFTGYNVNLAERNVNESSNTNTAKFHRQKVHDIAARLKLSQNLNSMIEEIINSEGFVFRQYQVP